MDQGDSQTVQAALQDIEAAHEANVDDAPLADRSMFISRNFSMNLPHAYAMAVDLTAKTRAAAGAVAVRLAETTTPGEEVELPPDPWSNRPLLYTAAETGFRVYSVGRDGVDDGGIDDPANDYSGEPDVVVRVKRNGSPDAEAEPQEKPD